MSTLLARIFFLDRDPSQSCSASAYTARYTSIPRKVDLAISITRRAVPGERFSLLISNRLFAVPPIQRARREEKRKEHGHRRQYDDEEEEDEIDDDEAEVHAPWLCNPRGL